MKYADRTIIQGKRVSDHEVIVTIDSGRPLPHKCHHSPTGFEWGYGGSGPADLALSILAACVEEPETVKIYQGKVGARAWALHQDFKRSYVAGWGDTWSITVGEVRKWASGQADDRDEQYAQTIAEVEAERDFACETYRDETPEWLQGGDA
jgi:hypothetical protein